MCCNDRLLLPGKSPARPRTHAASGTARPARGGGAGSRPSASGQPPELPLPSSALAPSQAPDQQQVWQALRRRLSPNARLILHVLQDAGAAFTRLLRTCGGQALRIPRRLPPEQHALRRALGTDILQRLMTVFGGTTVYVPRCRHLLAALHRQNLIARFERYTASGLSSGAAVRCLAGEAACSERRIWQILKTCDSLPPEARFLPDMLKR